MQGWKRRGDRHTAVLDPAHAEPGEIRDDEVREVRRCLADEHLPDLTALGQEGCRTLYQVFPRRHETTSWPPRVVQGDAPGSGKCHLRPLRSYSSWLRT